MVPSLGLKRLIIKGEKEKMNKKLFLILCFAAVMSVMPMTGFAFEKGTKSIGGSISISTRDFGHGEATQQLYLSPNFNYFVIDNVSIEVSPLLSIFWTDNYDTSYSYGIGIGGRYYYKMFYGGINYNYHRYGQSGKWGNNQDIMFSLGYLKEIAKHVYLDFSLSYLTGIGQITGDWGNMDNDQQHIAAGVGIAIFFQ
jgi:hypothetical protein